VLAESFERFVESHGERAFQFAYRLCGNMDDAKDLVQESFRRLLERWDRYDPAQPLDAWFFAILRNVYRDGRRRFAARRQLSLDAPLDGDEKGAGLAERVADGEDGTLETLARRDVSARVRCALASLSEEHRAVLLLCDVEEWSYQDVSRALELPLGTVRSRVSRARSALRELLCAELEER